MRVEQRYCFVDVEKSTATELAKERDEEGKFELSTVEQKEVKAYTDELKLKMKPFEDAKNVFTNKISELKAAISKTHQGFGEV